MLFRETVAVYCENHTEHTDKQRQFPYTAFGGGGDREKREEKRGGGSERHYIVGGRSKII
jgi:hypothetical protein